MKYFIVRLKIYINHQRSHNNLPILFTFCFGISKLCRGSLPYVVCDLPIIALLLDLSNAWTTNDLPETLYFLFILKITFGPE